MVRVAQIYVNPDASSSKLGEITRGREVVVLDQSREWVHVLASLTNQKDITGWMLDKGIVHLNTPNGDQILFGEAAASELQASLRGGRKGAADDARRLYYRVFDYFPKSPLAGEALYRAADIIWQLDASDVRTRGSAKTRDLNDRPEIQDEYMRLVEKKFPRTKWADMASFNLIENKLCGDWTLDTKCPEKEADLYEKYAADHPDSPKAPEGLYTAASRRAALIEMYKTENRAKESDQSRARVKADCEQAIAKYPTTDWAYRCRSLQYLVDQGIPTYGNAQQ
jgi:Bacterial SH3 domain